jgi:hypothetical protein
MITEEYATEIATLYEETFGEGLPHSGQSLITFLEAGVRAIESYTNKQFEYDLPIYKTILIYWVNEALHPFDTEKVGDYSYKRTKSQWKFMADGISDVGW